LQRRPILDVLSRSGDIRDQSLKWSKIDRNFACLGPKFFWGESPEFLEWVIKLHQIPTMWQSFRAIGRRTSENEWRKKITSRVKHKPVRNGCSGRPNKQLQ